MNFTTVIRDELLQSEIIQDLVGNRMRPYVEPNDTSGTFIIMTPIEPEALTKSVSDTYLAEQQHFQMDVQSTNYNEAKAVFKEVRRIMINELNMYPQAGGLDDYFGETKRYLISVRFIGTPQKLNYKKSVI